MGSHEATIWDLLSGQKICTLHSHTGPLSALAFTRLGRRVVSAGQDGTINIWDADTGREILTLTGPAGINRLAFGNDGHRLLAAANDGTVKFWDATPLP
jgi:WD40 repeat protein